MTRQPRIYTGWITLPNLFAKVVNETPKTVTVEVVGVDPAAKGLDHPFDTEYYEHLVGQTYRFWKETGKEFGGDWHIILREFLAGDTDTALTPAKRSTRGQSKTK